MFKKTAPVLLLGSALLAMSIAATAQDSGKGGSKGGTSVVPTAGSSGNVSAESLIQRYGAIAGTTENATSLVNGLRNGTLITLLDPPPPPPPPAPAPVAPPPPAAPTAPPPAGLAPPPQQLGAPTPPPPAPAPQVAPAPPPPPPAPVPVTFTPPTGNMGWGNVDIALALAEAKLAHIPKPTAAQVANAFMDANAGILVLRAKGMGWPNVAKELGFVLK